MVLKISSYFFIFVIIALFFTATNPMDQKKAREIEIKEKLKKCWAGKELKAKELMEYAAIYKNQTKYKEREFTIGSFDGKSGLATTHFDENSQYECRFEILKEILGLDFLDQLSESDEKTESFGDESGEPSLAEKNYTVGNDQKEDHPLIHNQLVPPPQETEQNKKSCCCVVS